MALPGSGPLILGAGSESNNIRAEFDGPTSNINLQDYYRGGGLVPDTPNNASIPTSGAIDMLDFYGAEAVAAPTVTIGRFQVSGNFYNYIWKSADVDNFPAGGFGSINTTDIYGATLRAIQQGTNEPNLSTGLNVFSLQVVFNGHIAASPPFSEMTIPFPGSAGTRTVSTDLFTRIDGLQYQTNETTDELSANITRFQWSWPAGTFTHGLVVGQPITITFLPP
jgi:hypothetical protein